MPLLYPDLRPVLFLMFCCKDRDAILEDMKALILKACNGGYPVSR